MGEPPIRSFFARLFYKVINRISEADVVDGARDFRLMKREMVDAIVSMCEYNRFFERLFGWIGFRTKWLPYKNVERVAGETKWSFFKLFKYSLDGIVNFSAGTAVHCLSIGSGLDVYRVFHDSVCRCEASDFWRSCCGMGINGMYHSVYWRRSALVYGHYGTVSGKSLFGSQASSALYYQ